MLNHKKRWRDPGQHDCQGTVRIKTITWHQCVHIEKYPMDKKRLKRISAFLCVVHPVSGSSKYKRSSWFCNFACLTFVQVLDVNFLILALRSSPTLLNLIPLTICPIVSYIFHTLCFRF